MIEHSRILTLHPQDNIAVALADLSAGQIDSATGVKALQSIKQGHKIAIRAIHAGQNILRYGQTIGQATADIEVGEHVHVQNLGMGEHTRDYAHASEAKALAHSNDERTFDGYHRADGSVGTRNYLGILTSVNCSGSVAKFIAEAAEKSGLLDDFPNIDGIVPITHGTGCGMSGNNEGYDTLFRTLSGYAQHPNFGGILLIGLGCEVMQIADLVGGRSIRADGALRYMTIQQIGGTRKTVEKGLEELRSIAELANTATRKPAPVSHLMVGMQCGGSDGYSGITANPALGVASDILVQHGGTTILSETSEIYGAEHLLTRRAETVQVGEKLIERVKWWEDYTARNKGSMDNNPSPGNKKGGLTTILEKSLGAAAKGGTTPLMGVYKYAEPITARGFTFMDSPGYDPASVTGQIAGGCNLVCFTTGRGSAFGSKPAPTVKIATNTEMATRMSEDMDIDAGEILSKGVSVEEKGREIYQMFLRVASGEKTKSEAQGLGDYEFVPWQIGAVM